MQHINILIRQIKTLGYETAKCFILESVPTTDALEIRIQGRLKTECPLKLNPSTVHTQYLGGKFKKAAMERAAFVRFGGNGGIRTHGGFAPSADFESAAFSLSATFPIMQ